MAHEFYRIEGREQSIAIVVTFSDLDGKSYVVLGRGDPRYRDIMGECLRSRLPVGPFQFIGGRVEVGCANDQERWFDAFPNLRTTLAESLHGNPYSMEHVIALNGFKELAEEMGLSFEKLRDCISNPTLHWIHSSIERQHRNGGGSHDVHYMHLDLGTLTPTQIEQVKGAVQPGDDTLQSIIIATDKLSCDAEGELNLKLADGDCKVNDKFDGFPEWEEWLERYQSGIQANYGSIRETYDQIDASHIGGIAFSENLHHVIESAQMRIAGIEKVRENYRHIHETIRGLDGIDLGSLYTEKPIGLYVVEGSHLNDSAIFNNLIERKGMSEPQKVEPVQTSAK